MTSSVKPLPAHGTYARANGSPGYRKPCKCEPCGKERRRVHKRGGVNRQLGRPGLIDATPARRHLATLHTTMSWEQIGEIGGCDASNLHLIADGQRTQIRRDTLRRILAVQPEKPAPGKYLDATGTRRRIQALRAIGWSSKAIAQRAGSAEVRINLISTSRQPTVRHMLAVKIGALFTELHRTPAPAGRSATRAKRYAESLGWAPPAAWDDIDDPNAIPDWTGHCGTDRGYWMHSLQQLPMCPRCETAHADWLADNAHLPVQELNQARFRARNAAASREADLAHDARELLRVSGLDTQQAAERLGVTRNHLQQVLLRHPEKAAADQQDEVVAA